jgi:hypothetical protein
MIHFSMAAAATPLVLGHIFMATVNPDTRVGLKGMITGWVSREWAQHHYRHWYDEHFGHLEHAVPAVASAEPAPPALPASVALPVSAPQPAAALPIAARPSAPAVPVVARPLVPAPPIAARRLVPAAAVTERPQAARPVKILWPPDARTADPSFAS